MTNNFLHVVEKDFDDLTSKIVKAWQLPIKVNVYIEDTVGDGIVHFYSPSSEREDGFVSEIYLFSWTDKPKRLKNLIIEKELANQITLHITEWIVIFIREGKFYLDDSKTDFINSFNLEAVADRATRVLNSLYRKYFKEYN